MARSRSRTPSVRRSAAQPSERRRNRRLSTDSTDSADGIGAETAVPTPVTAHSPPSAPARRQPDEFMGPPGAAFMIASLPVTAVLFTAVCNADGCPSFDPAVLWRSVAAAVAPHNLFQPAAFVVVLAWFLFQALLHMAIPGPVVKGTVLPDGSAPLPYCVNGFRCLVVSLYAVVALHVNDVLPLVWVADHALQLAVATAVYSTVLSVYLYWSSFRGNRLLADGGNTGYAVYDFFMGRELNPRWGSFDWKFFCELRPGLIGWTVLNFAYAAKQAAVAGSVSAPMLLVCAFQLYYVIDALWNEAAILTTMDITTDGFGYMLVFGDLVWVPFTYGLQARYLSSSAAMSAPAVSGAALAAIFALHTIGLWIFRGANSQKNTFRTNPSSPAVQHLTFIKTSRGTKLITNGWWGMARHINYFGDWIMGLSWCLPCGFSHPLPYFYAAYFAILLIHRERRDDEKCHNKYQADWAKYCSIVPWRIIPKIY